MRPWMWKNGITFRHRPRYGIRLPWDHYLPARFTVSRSDYRTESGERLLSLATSLKKIVAYLRLQLFEVVMKGSNPQ